jgi:hypothetical protein
MSDEQTLAAPKKRVRRSLKKQLALALIDAEAAATADISSQKLVQTRLNILNKALSRERIDKVGKLKGEVARLKSENDVLKVEIERLKALNFAQGATSGLGLDAKLAQVEQEFYAAGGSNNVDR